MAQKAGIGKSQFLAVFRQPRLSLIRTSTNHIDLIKNGDIEIDEAIGNTVSKTAIKTTFAKGAGMAGVKVGATLGGPIGAILGGALGAFAGSNLGHSVYTAWKSETIVKTYAIQMKLLEEITDNTIKDNELKFKQLLSYKENIKNWKWKNIWQVIWPSEEFVLRDFTYLYLESKSIELSSSQTTLRTHYFKAAKLERQFEESGFFTRLCSDSQIVENEAQLVTETIFKTIQQCGVLRVNLLDTKISEWKMTIEKINREKRKIAA